MEATRAWQSRTAWAWVLATGSQEDAPAGPARDGKERSGHGDGVEGREAFGAVGERQAPYVLITKIPLAESKGRKDSERRECESHCFGLP